MTPGLRLLREVAEANSVDDRDQVRIGGRVVVGISTKRLENASSNSIQFLGRNA